MAVALHRVDRQNRTLHLEQRVAFKDAEMKEVQDLQPLIERNPGVIAAGLMVVATEFGSWDGANRRIDILGLDTNGVPVVVELKVAQRSDHTELQALRYAAMLSGLTFDQLVVAHASHLARRTPKLALAEAKERARQALLRHLGESDPAEVTLAPVPRIVLVAPAFSRELTHTALWLRKRFEEANVPDFIRCVSVSPYQLGGECYLAVAEVVPTQDMAELQVSIRAEMQEAAEGDDVEEEATTSRGPDKVTLLIEAGLLKKGDIIEMRYPESVSVATTDSNALRARLADIRPRKTGRHAGRPVGFFEWDYDPPTNKRQLRLSRLTREVVQVFGTLNPSWAYQGTNVWARAGTDVTLVEEANALPSSH